jgi:predicted transcriptional regulator
MSIPQKTATLSVRVEGSIKRRLQRLAKDTGRSGAFLAAQAIHEYLDVNEWQAGRIKQAIASIDAGKGIPHSLVKEWIGSWGSSYERPIPTIV